MGVLAHRPCPREDEVVMGPVPPVVFVMVFLAVATLVFFASPEEDNPPREPRKRVYRTFRPKPPGDP